jgi:RNA polymerase sigma factor for flagellar operon FliA
VDRKSTLSQSLALSQDVIKVHLPLVKRIAHHIFNMLPKSVDFEDLYQVGMIGLVEALKHYNKRKGAAFETYAGIRIRGHMLDEVRRNDLVPRAVCQDAKKLAQAIRTIEHTKGREAKDIEIAKALNIDLEVYHTLLMHIENRHVDHFEDLGIQENEVSTDAGREAIDPCLYAMREEVAEKLKDSIDRLSEKEKHVITLYYIKDMDVKEIASALNITPGRICQIRTQAEIRLHAIYMQLSESDGKKY